MENVTNKVSESYQKKFVRQRLGLKNKLLLTIISIFSMVSILSVGIYASTNTFAVNLDNSIEVEVRNVSGALYVKRTGGVLAEYDDSGNVVKSTTNAVPAPMFEELLYDIDNGGITDKLAEFNDSKINLNREYNELKYVFKYTSYSGVAKLIVSPYVHGTDKDKIKIEQKYCYSDTEPDWSGVGYVINEETSLIVNANVSRTLYIYACVSIETNGQSFSISDLGWAIDIFVEPAS